MCIRDRHYTSNNSPLKKEDLLLVDAGCSLIDYYNGDITRTIPIGGKFSNEQKVIYEIVLSAQKNAIKSAVKGSNSSHVHNVALTILIEGLKEIGLLSGSTEEIIENQSYKHLYMHRTGHWLGLDGCWSIQNGGLRSAITEWNDSYGRTWDLYK